MNSYFTIRSSDELAKEANRHIKKIKCLMTLRSSNKKQTLYILSQKTRYKNGNSIFTYTYNYIRIIIRIFQILEILNHRNNCNPKNILSKQLYKIVKFYTNVYKNEKYYKLYISYFNINLCKSNLINGHRCGHLLNKNNITCKYHINKYNDIIKDCKLFISKDVINIVLSYI
jgi:hypothetical protein